MEFDRKNGLKPWILGLVVPLLLAASGIGILLAMGSSKAEKNLDLGTDVLSTLRRMPIVEVDRVLAYPGDVPLDVDVRGVVVPFRELTLASEVAGRIAFKSPHCKIGRYVEEGELLFAIDKTDYEWEVERLTAQRDSERAQQSELDQDVANVQRMLALADEELTIQNRELERLEQLPTGFASATDLDQARRARLAAQNAKISLHNQLDMLATRRTRAIQAERLASAMLEQAKVNLARTEIRAPISGVVASESVEADSFVQKGATLCIIEDTRHVEISCNLRADQMYYILNQRDVYPPSDEGRRQGYELPKTDVTVSYWLTGRQNEVYEWKGQLSRYEGIGMNPQSRTVPVRILVENPLEFRRRGSDGAEATTGAPTALVRGMFVDCAIHTKPKRSMLMVPKVAVRPGGQLWVFDPEPKALEWSPEEIEQLSELKAKAPPEHDADGNRATATSSEVKSLLDLKQWEVGRLRVVRGLQLVRLYRDPQAPSKEYWVFEAQDEVGPQSWVITTSLATIGSGSKDFVRHWIKQDKP